MVRVQVCGESERERLICENGVAEARGIVRERETRGAKYIHGGGTKCQYSVNE